MKRNLFAASAGVISTYESLPKLCVSSLFSFQEYKWKFGGGLVQGGNKAIINREKLVPGDEGGCLSAYHVPCSSSGSKQAGLSWTLHR